MPLLVLPSTDTFHNTLYWSSGSLSTANHEAPVKPADPFAESLVLVALHTNRQNGRVGHQCMYTTTAVLYGLFQYW